MSDKPAISDSATVYAPLASEKDSTFNGKGMNPGDTSLALNLPAGTMLEKYRLELKLGQGSMGAVFLARHKDLNRHCALKILNPKQHRIVHDDYLALFREEARLTSLFNHPHIIITHDVGSEGELHFIEMEYLSGGSLADYVSIHKKIDPIRATRLVMQAAHGLAEAHRQGLLHRDLKLGNILLTSDQRAKLVDFGFAFRFKQACQLDRTTLVGTPGYLAPELFTGESASPITDIYALGICYYALLTGKTPSDSAKHTSLTIYDLPAHMASLMTRIRDDVDHLPLEILHCLDKMLHPSPENRPQSAYQVMQMLSAALGELEDLDTLIHQAFEFEKHIRWQRNGDRYDVYVELPYNRKQRIFINTSSGTISQRLVEISTICCQRPYADKFAENALRINTRLAHGRICLQHIDGVEHYVMQDAYPLGTVDAEEIRRCVLEMAEIADTIEQELARTDHH